MLITARRRSCGARSLRGSSERRLARGFTNGGGTLTPDPALPGISDLHVHIQPWRQLKPKVAEVMRKGQDAERLKALMDDPRALLEVLDASGIWRVGLINYPSPDLMG